MAVAEGDTIAAIATAMGRGGVGVIRISGSLCPVIAKRMLGKLPEPRLATFCKFFSAQQGVLDSGLALYFPKPNSFTGEDVLELQGHGGPVILQMVLNEVLSQGAKLAQPGEFTHRAFMNGKLDLAQAEAVADLIDASTQAAALGATRSLQGQFSEKINELSQSIMALRILSEAGIDFSEEEVDLLSDYQLLDKLQIIINELDELLQKSRFGQLLKDGLSVAIVGQPNAGKSSLLNALTQENTAIVTPIAGTTRDLVKATIQIDGIPVHLVDTAGIRLEADVIEQEGILRAKAQLGLVDKILLLIDATHPDISPVEEDIIREYGKKVTVIFNKIDLNNLSLSQEDALYISAKTGEGIDVLLDNIKNTAGAILGESSAFISRERHVKALQMTLERLLVARVQLKEFRAFELAAEELKYAQECLGEIVGKVSSDDLLGEIFSQFCIGK